jgi:hypothetical protein
MIWLLRLGVALCLALVGFVAGVITDQYQTNAEVHRLTLAIAEQHDLVFREEQVRGSEFRETLTRYQNQLTRMQKIRRTQ